VIAAKHDIERISGEIHQYLLKHPNAADTVEGIARWWLVRQRYQDAMFVVQEALEYLVKRGLVVQSLNADKQCIYGKKKLPLSRGGAPGHTRRHPQ